MERYRDPLLDLSNADVRQLHTEPPRFVAAREEWWLKFVYAHYDWDDPEFKKKNRGKNAYRPILLSKGYFAMVSVCDYRKLSAHSWHANVQLDRESSEILRVYARRNKRKTKNGKVYMHVDIAKSGTLCFVDHVNGYGLDDRRVNLAPGNKDANGTNIQRRRTKHFGLPPGIHRTKYGRFIARFNYSVRGKRFVTVKNFKTMEAAVRWRNAKRKAMFKRAKWVDTPKSVNFPLFPPLKAEYKTTGPTKAVGHYVGEGVPFF